MERLIPAALTPSLGHYGKCTTRCAGRHGPARSERNQKYSQTDRNQTDREKYRQTERNTGRRREIQADGDRNTVRQTEPRQTQRNQTGRQKYRQTVLLCGMKVSVRLSVCRCTQGATTSTT